MWAGPRCRPRPAPLHLLAPGLDGVDAQVQRRGLLGQRLHQRPEVIAQPSVQRNWRRPASRAGRGAACSGSAVWQVDGFAGGARARLLFDTTPSAGPAWRTRRQRRNELSLAHEALARQASIASRRSREARGGLAGPPPVGQVVGWNSWDAGAAPCRPSRPAWRGARASLCPARACWASRRRGGRSWPRPRPSAGWANAQQPACSRSGGQVASAGRSYTVLRHQTAFRPRFESRPMRCVRRGVFFNSARGAAINATCSERRQRAEQLRVAALLTTPPSTRSRTDQRIDHMFGGQHARRQRLASASSSGAPAPPTASRSARGRAPASRNAPSRRPACSRRRWPDWCVCSPGKAGSSEGWMLSMRPS